MANPTVIPEQYNRPADPEAPRIGEQFVTQLIDDIILLEVEDYITIRAYFRCCCDDQLLALKEALNYMNRQLDIVRFDRKRRVNKEIERAKETKTKTDA